MIYFFAGLIIGLTSAFVWRISVREELLELKKQNKDLRQQARKFDSFNGLSIGDDCFFFMQNAVRTAVITSKTVIFSQNIPGFDYVRVVYQIDENPCGSQYTKTLYEHDVFATKEELIQTL